MRFGIGVNTAHTLEEVGLQFAVTRERIRQIEAKALRKLKHPQPIENPADLPQRLRMARPQPSTSRPIHIVMAGDSRSKNGVAPLARSHSKNCVASLAYESRPIYVFLIQPRDL